MTPSPDTKIAMAPADAARHSLASGTAGTALLHIERALTGTGTWTSTHAQVRKLTSEPVVASEHSALYYGAPTIAFVLHAAAADGIPRYRSAAEELDAHVVRLARQRLEVAACRAANGSATAFGEYDLFYGLTGFGVHLLRRMPGSDTLADVLRYIISLTRPRCEHGEELPGWWVAHDPDPILPTPGGHVNAGMAHGAAGLLALLSIATRRGVVVDGQAEAIEVLAAWFDRWRQDSSDGGRSGSLERTCAPEAPPSPVLADRRGAMGRPESPAARSSRPSPRTMRRDAGQRRT